MRKNTREVSHTWTPQAVLLSPGLPPMLSAFKTVSLSLPCSSPTLFFPLFCCSGHCCHSRHQQMVNGEKKVMATKNSQLITTTLMLLKDRTKKKWTATDSTKPSSTSSARAFLDLRAGSQRTAANLASKYPIPDQQQENNSVVKKPEFRVTNLSQMSDNHEFLYSGEQSQAGKQRCCMKGEKVTASMCRSTKRHMPFFRGCCIGIRSCIRFPK